MTELERQLTAPLERLSAQYETEQRRHSEQVIRLAEYYGVPTASRRGRWR